MQKNLREWPVDDCATVWFARLERAKGESDFEAAAQAVRELRRLGIVVQFESAKRKSVSDADLGP